MDPQWRGAAGASQRAEGWLNGAATASHPVAFGLAALLACLLGAAGASAQDYAPGEKLTLLHCGRCHVVSERNRYGGIGSTPSFAALRGADDWEDRFRAFYALNPHPAFTQVPGVTPPFVPERPSPIHPVVLTPDEIETIIGYARSIAPKDLGAPVR